MTSGETLKKQLNLEKYPNVYISFVIGSSPAIYLVLYDSKRKNMPISRQYMQVYSNVIFFKRGEELRLSTPMYLEKTNLNLNTGTLVVYDIAMSGMTRRESFLHDSILKEVQTYQLREGHATAPLIKKFVGNLKELTLKDLDDSGRSAISDRTYQWFNDRNKNGYTASKSIKLIDCNVNQSNNTILFQFLAEATEGKVKDKDLQDSQYDYSEPKGEVDPKTFNIGSNGSKTYEIQIQFLDLDEFVAYLKTTPDNTKVGREDINYLISNMDVKYFSNSPSFNYQGFANIATQLGLSIYPQTITSKQWMPNTFNGEFYLDKHLYSFIRSYKFFAQQMASMLGKKLRDRSLI